MLTKPVFLPALVLLSMSGSAPAVDIQNSTPDLHRGRYLLMTSGCNDCHTDGYMESNGTIPEPEWLTGSSIGFQGPWGTTYPVNLRLHVQGLSEDQWVKRAREPMRPPMPWFSLRDMTESDLRSIYRYLRAVGPAGAPAPEAVPPGVQVQTPYFDFTPKNLPQQQAKHKPE